MAGVKCKNPQCGYTSPKDVGELCPRCSEPFEKEKKEKEKETEESEAEELYSEPKVEPKAPAKEPYYPSHNHKATQKKK
jgi:hypothetical protein